MGAYAVEIDRNVANGRIALRDVPIAPQLLTMPPWGGVGYNRHRPF